MAKIKTSVALDVKLLSWVDKQISRKRFASRSHAIEFALKILEEKLEKAKL